MTLKSIVIHISRFPPENITIKETKLVLFCTLTTHLLNSCVKKILSTLCFIASIKNIEQNIRENIVQCCAPN